MMQAKPETWQIILFLAAVATIILALGSAIVLSIVDVILQSRRRLPSRFRRIPQYDNFDQNELQAVANTLGFELVEALPHQIRNAVTRVLGIGIELPGSGLLRKVKNGTYALCNVRHEKTRSMTHQDGSAPTRWTDIHEYTALVYHADCDISFPSFTLGPNPTILGIIKVFDKWRYGGPRFKEDPGFHQKILVATFEPDALVRILTPSVRDVLKANSDLTTVAMDRLIIVYDRSTARRGFRRVTDGGASIDCQIVDPQDWPQFHQAARGVVRAILTAHIQTLQGR